ncbi:MAG: signal peptidase I [Patescibacteria group bacterium]
MTNEFDKETNSEELNNLDVPSDPARDFLYFVFDLLKTAVVVFVLAFSLRYFAVQPFIVDGESMMPNYVNGEYLLAEKISYLSGQPKRGDVVVFRYPGNPNVNYIKRIIGLPNETVKIENNKITVYNQANPKGVALSEEYLPSSIQTYVSDRAVLEKTLQSDEYFVMGDNRQHSSDSREWGALPKSNIVGRTWLSIKPLDRLQVHGRVQYPGLSVISLRLERSSAQEK